MMEWISSFCSTGLVIGLAESNEMIDGKDCQGNGMSCVVLLLFLFVFLLIGTYFSGS